MNTLRNTVKIIGHLGVDPEIIEYAPDSSLARFSVATNSSYKTKGGEWKEQTTWHNIVAWGTKAEWCKKQLKKGSKIILKGKLRNNTYETKAGEKRSKIEIALQQFLVLNSRSQGEKTQEQ